MERQNERIHKKIEKKRGYGERDRNRKNNIYREKEISE